jgi:antitoxin component of RelBE/YafQ-DinJ toxin-antitoxin module
VRTYHVCMNITLSVDDEVVRAARERAEAMGTSVNQLVREYLEQLAGKKDRAAAIAELRKLSAKSKGNVQKWKFNREEIQRYP